MVNDVHGSDLLVLFQINKVTYIVGQRRGLFIHHTHYYHQYKNSLYPRTISDWNLLSSMHYVMFDSATLDSFKNRLPVVITKLVPPPPRCDTHLGETNIDQIQIQNKTNTRLMYCKKRLNRDQLALAVRTIKSILPV